MKRSFLLIFIFSLIMTVSAQERSAHTCQLTIARLKYGGGGDWYTGPSMLPNLVKTAKERTLLPLCDSTTVVEVSDQRLFHFPFLFMTGHGEVRFTPQEKLRLRKFLIGGGFLWADDNYGMDRSFRREMAALFPENPLTELPKNHPVFKSVYNLPGLPKIHEHDGERAQAFGIFFEGKMVVLYTYSADIGNALEDPHIHKVGEERRELGLQMGINILNWFFNP
ncbi:MAG: DUF4159 domain-containing protein [Chitinispirillales bacterium]|jgi:hypothetical protein|nr:DUF4159 domain-containing protein [Chitinispirillales bacterium]